MPLQLKDLAALGDPAPGASGQPLTVDLGLIDEDPEQPRIEFDPTSLQELAATIADRGVCQPVSVRLHPEVPGRYVLNFGARRLRAAKLAGRQEIPAFMSEAGDGYDQVIENEQREALTPMELALFVRRRMSAGESPAEIARRLGKSRGYVTLVSALIDAPEWLLELYRSGKCRGVRELYELRRLHEASPGSVEGWAAERESISRTDLEAFRADGPIGNNERGASPGDPHAVEHEPLARSGSDVARVRAMKACATNGADQAVIEAEYRDSVVAIDLSAIPEGDGTVYVRTAGGERRVVPAPELRLLRVVPG
jgi:ParB family transcriptional regulator, chromosome partitioning protein